MKKIGLLGGSFNPAHAGHLHLSRQAYKHLGLDEVWWLVSPQNPLKSAEQMADYETRLASAQRFCATQTWLKICEIEQLLGLNYTIDTLSALMHHCPQHQFVWLMGSDNLAQFHRWHQWRKILNSLPICVIDRAPHAHHALRSPAALAYKSQRIKQRDARQLAGASAPCWVYLFVPRHEESATRLRNLFGKNAFLQ